MWDKLLLSNSWGVTCNFLLLEVESKKEKNRAHIEQIKGLDCHSYGQKGRKVLRSENRRSKSLIDQNPVIVQFSTLSFVDKKRLLKIVTSCIRMQVPDATCASLFPCQRGDEDKFWKDMAHLSERRAMLIQMLKHDKGCIDLTASHELPFPPSQIVLKEIKDILCCSSSFTRPISTDYTRTHSSWRRRLGDYVKKSIRWIPSRCSPMNGGHGSLETSSSNGENKDGEVHDFSSSGDSLTIGLTLQASTMELSSDRVWPCMNRWKFALYRLPIQAPIAGQEYAGLWGGTFGWPPGNPTEDTPGKALFFLVLSYSEASPGKRLLRATKILEGNHYIQHRNGSAMFVANVDEPSTESFPWNSGADSHPIGVKQAFTGEGISSGNGFRYPGSKPGSLFVLRDGVLVFLWKETSSVLKLQRLNLEELLKKGERVPALPPIDNFSYLTRSYSNVFAGIA